MAIRRCRFCRCVLHGDPEKLGARCPECRRALYERPTDPTPLAELVEQDACIVHPTAAALGTCPRCGNFFCDVCHSLWRGRTLCLACVERALDAGEANPEDARGHRRQALLGVVFGMVAWLFAIFVFVILSVGNNATKEEVVGGCLFLALFGYGSAAVGMGQAAAAIRARGDRLLLATMGLILSGLYLGMLVGYLGVSLWQE